MWAIQSTLQLSLRRYAVTPLRRYVFALIHNLQINRLYAFTPYAFAKSTPTKTVKTCCLWVSQSFIPSNIFPLIQKMAWVSNRLWSFMFTTAMDQTGAQVHRITQLWFTIFKSCSIDFGTLRVVKVLLHPKSSEPNCSKGHSLPSSSVQSQTCVSCCQLG